ncbi:DUF3857 domain-containing protein [Terriglobus aquaticus]|uniref:DUF3857 domain-containing protein n=1 Tax=Terriglobus aquaticus TaxID=940139 RepID=A0ABW9KJ94_9BACT
MPAPAIPAPLSSVPAATFSDEAAILRNSNIVLQYNADGTGTRTESQSFKLQSEAAVRQFGVVSLVYASATQTADFVYVRVRRSDGSVVDTPLTDVQDQTPPVTQQAPFYSDIKLKQMPVRGLRVGDIVEWQTHVVIKQAEAANQFWGTVPFVRDLVTQHQTVELRFPSNLNPTVWTNPANHVTPERTTEGKETVYRWQWQSLKPTLGKQAEAAAKAEENKVLSADEELDKTEGRLPDVAFTTFPDWAAVGAWYRGLEADRMQPDATIRAKVAEITAHSATEQDKIRAVYDWVASDVRYIGIALGVGRYQPHAAATVLQNQYGDCKDKHTLLASMLIALGQQPDAVLIGSGVRFNPAVPSPAAFNHLITRITLNGKPVWLDTTSEVAPFQVLVPTIRDKDALVVPPTGVATIQKTPARPPFAPFETMAVKGSLDKDLTSESQIAYTLRDDNEIGLRAGLRQLSPAQHPEAVQRVMQFYGFGGTTSDAVIDNLNDQEKPLVLRFHYHREHSSEWGENRVTAVFSPTLLPVIDEKKPPTTSILLGQPRESTSTVDMQLAPGWSAELPEAIHQSIPQARIDTTYRLDGRTLHAERKLSVLAEKMPAADWKTYQKWYTASSAGDVPYIQLIPPSGAKSTGPMIGDGAHAKGSGDSVPQKPKTQAERLAQAKRLVESAGEKLNHNDPDGAEQDLNEARTLNESQEYLWGNLGVVAQRRGNQTEAVKDYRKEVELYPTSEFAWRNLVNLQASENRKAAIATTRDWIAADPSKSDARTTLVQLLWADNQNAAALAAAKDAAAALPGDVRESNAFQLLLGQAQMRGGETAAGAETLSHLIQGDATALQDNDAVYELAKNHLQLKVAETTQRDVLKKLAAESTGWTGDESPNTMAQASSLFTAAWDTMGWILYEEGKYAEAETYIRPAWLNRPNPEIGEHLGDVQAALHKDRDAALTYELVDYIVSKSPGLDPAAAELTLKPKVEAARKKFGDLLHANSNSPDLILGAERTFPIPGQSDTTGTATYSLLFTRERVLRARPAPNATTTPAQDKLVQQANLAALFPPNDSAALFRTVYLVCKANSCSVRLTQ